MEQKPVQRRLTDFASDTVPAERHRLEEIADVEVIIQSAWIGNTPMGTFAAMEVILPTGEIMTFVTTGYLVVYAINNAIQAEAFPLPVTFTRTGRAWNIK